MKKVVVIGLSGSGKSTLATRIATRNNLKHIELDGLFWLENWKKSTDEDFLQKIESSLDSSPSGWVIDGFYGQRQGKRPFEEADTIIFLDIPLWISVSRILRRGTVRIVRRQKLWGKCQENFPRLIKLSLLVVKWRPGLRLKMDEISNDDSYSHVDFRRFCSNKEADAWFHSLDK